MRELKFRIWNTEVQSYLKQYNNSECIGIRYVGVMNSLCRDIMYLEEQCIFQQFTGLKDKNGVEIYEGDIVKYELGNKEFNEKVVWENYTWCLNSFDDNSSNPIGFLFSVKSEVIGNIFENSEQLES